LTSGFLGSSIQLLPSLPFSFLPAPVDDKPREMNPSRLLLL
jgi:hypothetical protein